MAIQVMGFTCGTEIERERERDRERDGEKVRMHFLSPKQSFLEAMSVFECKW
jgi:hypothetical protein